MRWIAETFRSKYDGVPAANLMELQMVGFLVEAIHRVCAEERELANSGQLIPQFFESDDGFHVASTPKDVHHLTVYQHRRRFAPTAEPVYHIAEGDLESGGVGQIAIHERCQGCFSVQQQKVSRIDCTICIDALAP